MDRECETCRHYSFKVWGDTRSISGKCFALAKTRYVNSTDVCCKWESEKAPTSLVSRLRGLSTSERRKHGSPVDLVMLEAANRIDELEEENKRLFANAKYDAELLVVYHQWCFKHGCAPSSSDLMTARTALAGEKKDAQSD